MRARTLRRSATTLVVTACLAVPAVVAARGVAAAPPVPADPAVVTEWNEIAARTIYTENATPVPAAALDAETMDARIWLGFHFRKAMTDGNRLGHQVSDWTADHYFRPAR
jgi:hypothetical protein